MASATTTESIPLTLYKEMQKYHNNTVEPFTIELRQEDDDGTRQEHDDGTRIDYGTHIIILQITKATNVNGGIITLEVVERGFARADSEERADENPLPYIRMYIGTYYILTILEGEAGGAGGPSIPDLKYVAMF